ncbi:MAG: nuclear transport factor 2 family protein [Proteobacteria bacterium]|nr:nuclear transport factor 2 family protein [Pseudomonadota bacterium]
MVEEVNRRCVLDFLKAFYCGDVEATLACCDDDFDTITYAPIELFPHLGHKHGKSWIPDAIETQQKRYSSRKYELHFIAVDGPRVATMMRLALQKRNDQRVVQFENAEFFTLNNGRIREHRSFFDSFDVVEQVLGHDLTESFAATMRGAMLR